MINTDNTIALDNEWYFFTEEINYSSDEVSLNHKVNLVLVSEEFPPFTPGWIATYQKTLVHKLQKTWEMWNITVICKANWGIKEWISDENWVKVIRIKPYFENIPFLSETIWYKAKVAMTLIKERKNSKVDVIESPEWNQELFLYYIYNIKRLII